MKTLVFLALASAALAGSGGEYRLVVNEDNDHYFHLDSSKMTREDLRAYVDTFAVGGQVSHVFFSPCGQPANFDSKVWEPVWKRLEDPAFLSFAKGNRHFLSWPENCKLLHERGIDPYAVWIERSRELKISPWLSMRMNDVHFATHPRMQVLRSVKFWRDHPELGRHPEWDRFDKAHGEWKYFAFDYAHKEVRDYHLAMAKELLERYFPDGLELDWMRYVCHLTPGKERELTHVLTDFMRDVRRAADAVGAKAGRRIKLGVRIPSRYDYARDLGYDPETWAKEGLCDLFVVCSKDAVDYGCDVADWKRRLAPAAVIPGMDRVDCTHSERVYADVAGYRGWADAMQARGADGLYLFNAIYLPEAVRDEIWQKGLSPAVTATGPRRYVATYPDTAPDAIPEESLCQLPRPLAARIDLEIFAGNGRAERSVEAVLAFDRAVDAKAVKPLLNGIAAEGEPVEEFDFGTRYGEARFVKAVHRWRFPKSALKGDRNELVVQPVAGSAASVRWAEVIVDRALPEIDLTRVKGTDLWGGREAHPAVVNPVLPQDPATVVSLCGEWDFTTYAREGRRELPFRNGVWGAFYRNEWKNARKISVPGCWEEQGVGEPGMSEGWDPHWDNAVKPIRHKFAGVGWYRRTVQVPAAWSGRRVWLKVGGVKAIAWVWVNERQVALVDRLCETVKYDITDLVRPGEKATVVFQVDNRKPSRAGESNEMNKWGGIVRAVELEATPAECWIDDAWVRGDFDRRVAKAQVAIAGQRSEVKGQRLRLTIEGATVESQLKQLEQSNNPNNQTIEVPLRNFRPWSPEHPNLYTAKVELVRADGRVLQTRFERFGVRKLEVRGKEFYLNGRPYYFRGFGDDSVYPLTGQPPADRAEHRKHLAVARACGFNFVRLHTHCEMPEYFEAADELGILIQAELPYYSDVPAESFSFDPVRDVTEVCRTFRRHPSLAVYSMGNEGSFGPDLDRALHKYVKEMDPDRLKINQDCHVPGINPPEAADYLGGPITIWTRGECNPDRPFVTHEYMNLGVKLDSRLEPKFSGVWQPPVTRAARAEWLAKFGLDHTWGDRLQDAQHVLQGVWQKRGIECARTDPYCDGFCYWTIVDVVVANNATYSAQGMFNPFWEAKVRGSSAADVLVYNRPVGVFCDLRPNGRTFQSGATVDVDFLVSNYGESALASARVDWKLTADGATLASGTCPCGDLALGSVRKVAAAKIAVPSVAKNVKARIEVALRGDVQGKTVTPSDNSYPLWLFAARTVRSEPKLACADSLLSALKGRYAGLLSEARAAEADVVVAPYDSPLAREALARGQKTILLAQCGGKPNVKLGWWWMGSQVGTAFLDHPVFKNLPHDGALDELFFRIVKEGRELPLDGLKKEDLLAVGEGGKACYLYLGQAKVLKGQALLAFGLDVLADTVEGTALLDGMIDYVRSSAFAPTGVCTLPQGTAK